MKGLKYIKNIICYGVRKELSHEQQKKIRKRFNPKSVCDQCLSKWKFQTIDRQLLCSRCHVEYGNKLIK